jgi:hypothetical protein
MSYKSVVYDVLGLKMFNLCLLIDVGLGFHGEVLKRLVTAFVRQVEFE